MAGTADRTDPREPQYEFNQVLTVTFIYECEGWFSSVTRLDIFRVGCTLLRFGFSTRC